MRGFEPQALLGSGGTLSPGSECPIDRRVDLPGGSMTAIALLDQIVRQVPGVVWVVTYRKEPASASLQVNVGLLCWNGWHAKITVFQ